ncbi:MAG TPA: addiction module protein [Terriglobia bacterium]|nr:addiction module protein [Terriglobia bacterium]
MKRLYCEVCDTILVTEDGKCQTRVMARLEIDINKLTPEERLDLIEELWDSLSADPSKIPLTDAQAEELDRRMAEMDQDDTLGIPWETVLAQIRDRQ